MKIIFYIRKFKSLSHSSILYVIHALPITELFSTTQNCQKKKKSPCAFVCQEHESHDWWKLPERQQSAKALLFRHETISVRGHYVLPLPCGALSHLLSNSMDIAWPAVDSYWTFSISFYIYYFYFHVIYRGIEQIHTSLVYKTAGVVFRMAPWYQLGFWCSLSPRL